MRFGTCPTCREYKYITQAGVCPSCENESLVEEYGDIDVEGQSGYAVKTNLRRDGKLEYNVCFGTTDDGRRCNQITEGCFCSSHSHQDKAHSDVHTWEIKLANPPEISIDEWLEQEGDSQ